jgi:hypothetical protein
MLYLSLIQAKISRLDHTCRFKGGYICGCNKDLPLALLQEPEK